MSKTLANNSIHETRRGAAPSNYRSTFDLQGEDLFTFVDDDGGHDEDGWGTRIGPAISALFSVRWLPTA